MYVNGKKVKEVTALTFEFKDGTVAALYETEEGSHVWKDHEVKKRKQLREHNAQPSKALNNLLRHITFPKKKKEKLAV